MELKMLNKILDGIEVQCTPEEETEIRAEWEKNDSLKAIQEAEKQAEISAKESALAKLSSLGLTEDEVKALLGAK